MFLGATPHEILVRMWASISCHSGWPKILYIVEDDLQLPTLLLGSQVCPITPDPCGAGCTIHCVPKINAPGEKIGEAVETAPLSG